MGGLKTHEFRLQFRPLKSQFNCSLASYWQPWWIHCRQFLALGSILQLMFTSTNHIYSKTHAKSIFLPRENGERFISRTPRQVWEKMSVVHILDVMYKYFAVKECAKLYKIVDWGERSVEEHQS